MYCFPMRNRVSFFCKRVYIYQDTLKMFLRHLLQEIVMQPIRYLLCIFVLNK